MDARATAILATLVGYLLALVAIGVVARRRTRDRDDFFLGGRRLGPLVAAISASASSSSVWTLIGVSGYAWAHGLSAVWIFPACVGGFVLNWTLIAPRLRVHAAAHGALTLTDVLAGAGRPGARAVRVLASVLVVGAFTVYIAAQFQGAGETFERNLGLDATSSVLLGSAIVVAYTMLGGFWAVSLTDTLQGLTMALAALALPVLALVAAGGPGGLAEGLAATAREIEGFDQLDAGASGAAALGLVLGLLGIGLGYPGQPHVVNRFMALRDEAAQRRARRYALAWAVVVYAGMILLGLCARVILEEPVADADHAMLAVIDEQCPPVLAGIVLAAILSAVMSTADSQILVATSSLTHDLGWRAGDARGHLLRHRLAVLGLCAAAVLFALAVDPGIFVQVLSAWDVIGAAFGPSLVVILWRGGLDARVTLTAMATGAGLAVLGKVTPWLGPDLAAVGQRVVPYVAGFAVAAAGARLTPSASAR